MAANIKEALCDGEVAIAQGPLDQGFLREERAQLAPERDALEQRPGNIHARQTERQGRIHVEMRIAEGRAHQPAGRVDLLAGGHDDGFPDGGDLAAGNAYVQALAPVGKVCITDDQIEHGWHLRIFAQRSPRRYGCIRACGTRARRAMSASAAIDSR